MSVNDVRATLSIYGDREELTSAAVTAALGIQPTQGGFVIEREPMRQLGLLSASLFGTVYIMEDD